jgi:probable metal-binding protein
MESQQVHGHEIIRLVTDHPEGISLSDLAALSAREFGADARFHTCSGAELDLAALIEFLAQRDKIHIVGDLALPGGSPVCD